MEPEGKTPTKYPGVFRLKDGRYYLVATHVDPSGARRYRRKTVEAARVEDAAAERARLQREMEKPPTPPAPPPQSPTVSEYSASWLKAKRERSKASTRAHYRHVVEYRIPPDLLDREVDSLARADMDRWARWLEVQRRANGEPYSTNTLSSWWRPVCTLVRDAAADHGFNDPTYRVKPPRGAAGRRREKRSLTAAQLATLVETFAAAFPAWAPEVHVMTFSGMRPGELYALERGDIDRVAGVIHVTKAVWRGRLGATKTDDPRDVALTPALDALLAAHLERLPVAREGQPDLVFPAETGGYRGASALYKRLRTAAELAKIPVRVGPQVLRYTFNTLMVGAGVDRLVLRSQMGHADEEMTENYHHTRAEAKRAAVTILEGIVRANVAPGVAPEGGSEDN